MTEQEINRTIAELLGYTCLTNTRDSWIADPNGSPFDYTLVKGNTTKAWGAAYDGNCRAVAYYIRYERLVPAWATDTDAALSLFVDMEKLPGFSFSLSYGSNLHGDKWYWHCHVYIADWLACTEKGDTAAEAACKAWIKFKGMDKP